MTKGYIVVFSETPIDVATQPSPKRRKTCEGIGITTGMCCMSTHCTCVTAVHYCVTCVDIKCALFYHIAEWI